MVEDIINSKILGQLLLMQSIVISLPDKKSIFSFVCKGLEDIPGVKQVTFIEEQTEILPTNHVFVKYPVKISDSFYGDLLLEISDFKLFIPYDDYLKNFAFMIGVILEERYQRQLNERYNKELEERIKERTSELLIKTENLIESQRRFSNLMANIRLLSVMLDYKGDIIFCNNFFCEVTGYTYEEIINKNWFDMLLPDAKKENARQIFYKVMNGSDFIANYENEILTKQGEIHLISWNLTLLYDINKQIVGTASIGDDITERRKNEQLLIEKSKELEAQNEEYLMVNEELLLAKSKLEESEEKHRFLFENTIQGIVYQNTKGEIIYANSAAERILGLTFDQIRRRKSVDSRWRALHEDGSEYPGQEHPAMITLRTGKAVFNQIMHIYNPTTNLYTIIRINSFPRFRNKEDIPYEVVTTFEDITEQKRVEKEIIAAKEKAEENDRFKTAFLQNISHEIRTPLNAIMGFSDLINKNFNDKTKLEKFSNIIVHRSKDLLDIINDIIDISKIESGQLPINIEDCNLNELFTELGLIITEYKQNIAKRHIDLKTDIPYNSKHLIITVDKNKLKQVFINLLTNAYKYTNEGYVQFGYFLENNQLIFYVFDTGIGIKHDKLDTIFERFVRLEDQRVINVGGTGLGLSIVKGLVNLLGGKIWVESEPDKGSKFYFTVSYKESEFKESVKESTTKFYQSESLDKTIMIVEDDKWNAEYLKEVLVYLSNKILIAENGFKAFEIFEKNTVDIVLMDIRLPDISGYDVILQLKQQKPDLKIIAQTAYASNDEKVKALKLGCIDYLSKPIKKEILLEKVGWHLHNE